jgi:hypothetical protein
LATDDVDIFPRAKKNDDGDRVALPPGKAQVAAEGRADAPTSSVKSAEKRATRRHGRERVAHKPRCRPEEAWATNSGPLIVAVCPAVLLEGTSECAPIAAPALLLAHCDTPQRKPQVAACRR